MIEKAVRKLNGCVRQVENLCHSGASDQDILTQAKALLMQDSNFKKGFKFDHVWDIMKNFEKFYSSQRPSGVKKAKIKRKIDEGYIKLTKKEVLTVQKEKLRLRELKEENKILVIDVDSIVDLTRREVCDENHYKRFDF
uniref:Uncharacterized protein LOC104233635 n=1 Tax=Nicotiana sylvestris TaxID=4096 RepID=A0A1U7XFX8_NICSY|nr:PREDICTED: uncharacterized protein LOC104233635 [Nicotiana sylvestris]